MKRFLGSVCAFLFACATASVIGSAPAGAAMPACKAGDPAVWVTSSHKTYYMMGNSSAGKGAGGSYMCRSAAVKTGAKMSGKASSMMSSGKMSSGSTSSGAMKPMPMSGSTTTKGAPAGTVPGSDNGMRPATPPPQPGSTPH
jgi:hypothetical protein